MDLSIGRFRPLLIQSFIHTFVAVLSTMVIFDYINSGLSKKTKINFFVDTVKIVKDDSFLAFLQLHLNDYSRHFFNLKFVSTFYLLYTAYSNKLY